MQQTTLENVPLVSADSHISEPVNLFLEQLPERLRDRGPRIVEEDGQERVVFPTLEDDIRIKRDPILSGEDFSAEELKLFAREVRLAKMEDLIPSLGQAVRMAAGKFVKQAAMLGTEAPPCFMVSAMISSRSSDSILSMPISFLCRCIRVVHLQVFCVHIDLFVCLFFRCR